MRYLRLAIAFLIVILLALLPINDAGADNAWESVVNGNVSGNSVQFDYRGGSASYITSVTDGSTVTVTVDNTIANCIGSCTPRPDNWTVSINGQSFSGNTIEVATVSAVVSGQTTISVSGIDAGFWGGWYGPIFTVSVNSPAPVVEPSPSPSPTATPIPSPSPSETSTPSQTPEPISSPTPTPTASPEPSPSETPTATQSPSPEPTQSPAPQVNSVNGSTSENGELTLSAPIGKIFTSVLFASYGTPDGYSIGQCHAPNSIEKVAEIFLGKAIATIMAINDVFGDPCGGTYKSLAVSLAYSDDPQAPTPSPSPSPSPSSDTQTAVVELPQTPQVSPSPSAEPSPSPSPTLEPSPSPTPIPQPPAVETPQPQPSQEPEPSTPEPTPSPEPSPEPSPSPSPDVSPTPDETPTPEPSPEPSPSEPEPTPSPEPSPEPEPSSSPEPTIEPEPQTPEPEPTEPIQPSEDSSQLLDDILADGDVTAKEVKAIIDLVNADGKLSEEEKGIVAEALIAQFDGAPVTAAAIAEAGIDYGDLPPETPVETRVDESGNPIVITAEVADALQLVENPAELVGAIFTDPGKALMALGNIGADMSTEEREESQTVVVASVIVGAIASLSIRRM